MRNARTRPSNALIESLESRTFLSASPLHTLAAQPQLHVAPLAAGATPTGLSPSQVRTAYGFGAITNQGSGQTIAIVDAFDDPNVLSDLQAFDNYYGLPNPQLTVKKMLPKVRSDAGWALEISLDVQWAHAVAPLANILLVEAKSNSLSDLLDAVDTAAGTSGVSAISMSWGSNEFSGETGYDGHFSHSGITFVASSGDSGAPAIWPAVCPNVLAVGGTNLSLNSSNNYLSETGWSGSGGGVSAYEPKPAYQSALSYSKRATPDVAYNADPASGVSVYDTVRYNGQSGWFKVGGTSAGSPQWAALIAVVNQGRLAPSQSKPLLNSSSPTQTLSALYSIRAAHPSDFHDILAGNNTFSAGPGFDLVTGLGSPKADSLILDLILA